MVRRRGEWVEMVDGGGLGSPGKKWPLHSRGSPSGTAAAGVRSVLATHHQALCAHLPTTRRSARDFVLELAVGKHRVDPFPPDLVGRAQSDMRSRLLAEGLGPHLRPGHLASAIDMRLL